MKRRILFLCTHNSARSQMAEGLLRYLGGEQFEAYSAGTEATHVRPLAIQVMAELGIDIAGQASKMLDWYVSEPFDEIITARDTAAEDCPVFPGAKHRRHWSFPDSSQKDNEEEQIAIHRRVSDAICTRIEEELLHAPSPERVD
jgi:arsenate reductase (thioredoxin)